MASCEDKLPNRSLETRETYRSNQKQVIGKTRSLSRKTYRLRGKYYRCTWGKTISGHLITDHQWQQMMSAVMPQGRCQVMPPDCKKFYSAAIMPASTALATAWKRLWASNLRMMPDSSVRAAVRSMSSRRAMRSAEWPSAMKPRHSVSSGDR